MILIIGGLFMNESFSSTIINKEYDYSNAIVTVNDVFKVVKLCDYLNHQLTQNVI